MITQALSSHASRPCPYEPRQRPTLARQIQAVRVHSRSCRRLWEAPCRARHQPGAAGRAREREPASSDTRIAAGRSETDGACQRMALMPIKNDRPDELCSLSDHDPPPRARQRHSSLDTSRVSRVTRSQSHPAARVPRQRQFQKSKRETARHASLLQPPLQHRAIVSCPVLF